MPRHLIYRIPVSTGKLVGLSLPPIGFDWTHLRQVGITHLVSLCEVEENRDVRPLRLLYSCVLEDISDGEIPLDVEVDKLHLWRAAYHVWAALRVGRGVAVHCNGGRQRTGTVLAATLVLRGLPVDRAAELIDQQVVSAGFNGWTPATWHLRQIQNPPQELLNQTTNNR